MDEFGSRIQHSDDPSVKMVPFIYQPTMTAYSIFWPIKDLKQNGMRVILMVSVLFLLFYFGIYQKLKGLLGYSGHSASFCLPLIADRHFTEFCYFSQLHKAGPGAGCLVQCMYVKILILLLLKT